MAIGIPTMFWYTMPSNVCTYIFHEESKSFTLLSVSRTCIRVIFLVGEKSRLIWRTEVSFDSLCVLLITRLLRLVGRLGTRKPVRNRCVIEVLGGVFVLSIGFRIFCWYKGFRHRSESDLLLFSLLKHQLERDNTFALIRYCGKGKKSKEDSFT